MMQAGHAMQKAVIYPISRKVFDETGNNLTNWIMELAVPGDTPPKQDWSKQVDKAVFAGRFAAWKWDWLDLPTLIENGGTAYEYPMCDRDPLPQWSFGRVTLLGDAAHPMYPIGSNGASQAWIPKAWCTRLRRSWTFPAAMASPPCTARSNRCSRSARVSVLGDSGVTIRRPSSTDSLTC